MGTGPFKVVDHVSDEKIFMEAVQGHWRATPRIQRAEIFEIPEEATRLAMLETGEADIVTISLPNLDSVKAMSGVQLLQGKYGGKRGANVYLAGQYYSRAKDDGTPVQRELDTSRPWIGDPSNPQSMENARKVRLAMNMAIDRQTIIEVLLQGSGCPAYIFAMDSCHPKFNQEWVIQYDPQGAKRLLAEAGYANGFEFPFFIPTGVDPTNEAIGEALVPMWEAVGIRAKIGKVAYSARRPEMLARTIKDAWIFGHNGAELPETFASYMNYFTTRRVWNPGYEYDEARVFEDKLAPELEEDRQWGIIAGEWLPWIHQLVPDVPVASYRIPWAVGTRIASWPLHHHDARWPRELETLELKQ